jgi:two-component system OmpR family response regulator
VDCLGTLKDLHKQGIKIPVLVTSVLSSAGEIAQGLKAGADDYLAKPFYMVELLARVEALLRRLGDVRTTKLSVDDLEMDLIEQAAFRGGKKIDLLPRELKLLEYFLRRPGQVVTRVMLLKDVWQYDLGMETNVVDAHISNLRRKIDDHGLPSRIANVRKLGYMLRARAP